MTTNDMQNLATIARENSQAVTARDASRIHAGKMRAVHALRNAKPERFTLAEAQAIASVQRKDETNTAAKHAKESGFLALVRANGAEDSTVCEVNAPDTLPDFSDYRNATRSHAGKVRENQTSWKTGDVSETRNPLFDARQNRFEATDGKQIANSVREVYRVKSASGKAFVRERYTVVSNPIHSDKQETLTSKVRRLAVTIAESKIRRSLIPCEHLRLDLETEAASAIGCFLSAPFGVAHDPEGKAIHARFSTLADSVRDSLLFAFATDGLHAPTVRALKRCAFRACDARLARMSKTNTVETRFFDVFTDEPTASNEMNAVFINGRIDALIARARERASVNGNAKRSALACIKLLETARVYFLASVAGESAPLPFAHLVRTPNARKNRGQIRGGSKDCTGRLANSALFKRLLRLARFIGSPEIREALVRNARAV